MSTVNEVMKRDRVSREAHQRLWEENQRLRSELLQANMTIQKLTNKPMGVNAIVHAAKLDVPARGKQPITIGIVQCPKCGQYMEVEK